MKTMRLFFILGLMTSSHILQAQYTLILRFGQMDPFIGKRFEVRVTETGTGKEVGRKTIASIESNVFAMELYVLLQSRSYHVDFYVDENGNGMYDAPPADKAWRRMVTNAMQNTVINFLPDTTYTDITFPDAFPYSRYMATWGGKWKNLTFGSTDSIQAGLNLTCDSIFGHFATKGVFGNPAPVEFNYANALPPDSLPASDTIRFSLGAPWTGDVYTTNGELHGALVLGTFSLNFTGTVGAKQILALYQVIVGGSELANGYFYVRELEVMSSAPKLVIHEDLVVNASCFDLDDGSIAVTVEGGSPAYTYLWSNTLTTPFITDLSPGDYRLIVTDSSGCLAKDTFTITGPPPIVADVFVEGTSCFGTCDGIVTVSVTGGTPPYQYDIPGGLCEGFYTLFITDANGCVFEQEFFMSSPAEITISDTLIINATNGQSNGEIHVTADGGVAPFQYALNGGPFQPSNFFQNLPAGIYVVTIKDANGCTIEGEFEIQDVTAVNALTSNFSLHPNPAHSEIFIKADMAFSVVLMDMHGRKLKTRPPLNEHAIDVDDLPAGMYLLHISDGKGSAFQKVILE